MNEESRLGGARTHVAGRLAPPLARPYDSRADRPHRVLPRLLEVDPSRRTFRNLVRFGMHRVITERVSLDGLERARPDVERERGDRDTALVDPGEQLRREVQARGRRSDTPVVGRVDGLIPLLIGFGGRAL